MSQNLKKENCSGQCPLCPVLNILQRRIGNREITAPDTIEGMARHIKKERCPNGRVINLKVLYPANLRFKYGQADYHAWKPKDRNII